ncbi:hypothetical protein [Pseudomonas syringae]|uniref:Uncharacterized protein n=1 Tax=Pseudomonas syringae pv. aptata TaxID=83167 RepID=A0A0N8T7T8_PSEAP|nr:hypothetical protein [Pseudomonas syringae]KPY97712.1 Uncharacterized protein ALO85_02304 [Pseudomonas syringae pv. aptata]MDP5167640.1 hypothetical protein [Pseudomonas syringae pv. aptata str. DSM 50252]RMO50571.1 hypothetical protein ALQ40_01048 [Pseudomonas syringae]RMO57502.1 hypothetical protein ALQ37_200240 [Pseudomonas syringae pv. aptata]
MKLPKLDGVSLDPKFFSKHIWNADLVYFEGPLLSLYRDEQGADLLYAWLDCTDKSNRWCVIPISRKMLRDYLETQITLRDVFIESSWIAIFHTGSSAKRRNSATLTCWNKLPQEYHPDEDSFLSPDIATEAADKFAEEVSEAYFLGLDGDMYIDDIAAIPKTYQQLYSFHYGLEHLDRVAVRDTLDRLGSSWTGGFSAVHLFTGLNQVTPSIHRPQVMEMLFQSPGHIKLDLLPSLAKRIETSANQIHDSDSFRALEEFYSATYRYFRENNIGGFDDERELQRRSLPDEIVEELSNQVTFFFKLMHWEDYRAQFGSLHIDPLHQLRALLAYYRRLRKLKPYLDSGRLVLGRSMIEPLPPEPST